MNTSIDGTVASQPVVSVSILTYNQHDLIGRALDSALMQRTDFPFEIIVGDDCSDDGTQEVLESYRHRYPEKIKLILHPRRYPDEVPGRTNNVTNLLNCRGKYIAMLDGDDWWSDPAKLQRQHDKLEEEPDITLCLHDVNLVYDPASSAVRQPFKRLSHRLGTVESGRYTHRDLALRNRLVPHIGSAMFRSAYVRNLPEWFYEIIAADFALLLHVSTFGKVYYDDRVAGAYWLSPRGFQSLYRRNIKYLQRELRDLHIYARAFPDTRDNSQQTRGRALIHWYLFQEYRKLRQFPAALHHLTDVFRHDALLCAKLLLGPIRRITGYTRRLAAKRLSRSFENSAAIRS